MKLVSYKEKDIENLGIFHDGAIYPAAASATILGKSVPSTMAEFLRAGETAMKKSSRATRN